MYFGTDVGKWDRNLFFFGLPKGLQFFTCGGGLAGGVLLCLSLLWLTVRVIQSLDAAFACVSPLVPLGAPEVPLASLIRCQHRSLATQRVSSCYTDQEPREIV